MPLPFDLDLRFDAAELERVEDAFLPVDALVFEPDFADVDLLLAVDFDNLAPPDGFDLAEVEDFPLVALFAVDDVLADERFDDFAADDLDPEPAVRDEPDDFEDPDFEREDFLVAGIFIPPVYRLDLEFNACVFANNVPLTKPPSR